MPSTYFIEISCIHLKLYAQERKRTINLKILNLTNKAAQ